MSNVILFLLAFLTASPNLQETSKIESRGWEFFGVEGKVDSRAFFYKESGTFNALLHISNRGLMEDKAYIKYEFLNSEGKLIGVFFTEKFKIDAKHADYSVSFRIKALIGKNVSKVGVIPVVVNAGKTSVNNNYPKKKKVEHFKSVRDLFVGGTPLKQIGGTLFLF